MADEAELPNHLTPSELGTKQYWDDAYTRELSNHADSKNDEGIIWFDDVGAEDKMIDYLEQCADEGRMFKNGLNELGQPPMSFLDLGTGNGHCLFVLRDAGWDGPMLGVDYSEKSVELAKQIGATRAQQLHNDDGADEDEDEDTEVSRRPVDFAMYDILNPTPLFSAPTEGFDVVLDKGTFDAISLSAETSAEGQRIFERYPESVLPLVRQDGILIITSCNWTEEELRQWFEKDERGGFVFEDRLRYPSFTFGGKKGSSVVTLVFRKAVRK